MGLGGRLGGAGGRPPPPGAPRGGAGRSWSAAPPRPGAAGGGAGRAPATLKLPT